MIAKTVNQIRAGKIGQRLLIDHRIDGKSIQHRNYRILMCIAAQICCDDVQCGRKEFFSKSDERFGSIGSNPIALYDLTGLRFNTFVFKYPVVGYNDAGRANIVFVAC